jgi:hypothetical protein
MHLLYYWKPDNFREDEKYGRSFTLVQNNPAMLRATKGDSLWAFTRNSRGTYVLAANLVIEAVGQVTDSEYGRYCAQGSSTSSRYFDIERGEDIEPLIRKLSVKAEADALGQSFQGPAAVRIITDSDHGALKAFARDLQ